LLINTNNDVKNDNTMVTPVKKSFEVIYDIIPDMVNLKSENKQDSYIIATYGELIREESIGIPYSSQLRQIIISFHTLIQYIFKKSNQ
jgi:hypothetical protein